MRLESLRSLESWESCPSAFWPRVVESGGAVVEPSNHPTIHLTKKRTVVGSEPQLTVFEATHGSGS